MLDVAVVPDNDHVWFPAVPVLVLVPQGLAVQHLQDHVALVVGHVLDPQRELGVHEDRLLFRDGVHTDHGVCHWWVQVLVVAELGLAFRRVVEQAPERLEVVDRLEA